MIVYFDTSALIKLVVVEDESDLARRAWAAADEVVFSRLVEPEARAALAAARRAKRIDSDQMRVGKQELRWRLRRGFRIEVSDTVCSHAGDLAERHALRGYDAVHLASALAAGPEILLVTWDRELRSAAQEERIGLIPGEVH